MEKLLQLSSTYSIDVCYNIVMVLKLRNNRRVIFVSISHIISLTSHPSVQRLVSLKMSSCVLQCTQYIINMMPILYTIQVA